MPRILCLTCYNIFGPDFGAALRARHIFQLLARLGEVHVVLASDQHFENVNPEKLFGDLKLLDVVEFHSTGKWSVIERYRNEFDGTFLNTDRWQASDIDRERLRTLMSVHDIIWVHTLKVANHWGLWRWPSTVLDIDDIPSSFHRSDMAQAPNTLDKLRRYRQMRLWERREKRIVERFDALCVCSETDRRKLGDSDKIFVVPNGFSAPEKLPMRQLSVPPRLGFVGTFNYRPNREGVDWFIQRVWPQILSAMPQARLRLIGAGSENSPWQNTRNVDALGFLPDTESEMATWSASIVPLFTGGGTRIKIAESFSRLCPVVATSLGAFGYDVTDGEELWLADAPVDFAAKCLRVLNDVASNQAMAERARTKFLEHWTWDAQAGRVAAAVESVLQKR